MTKKNACHKPFFKKFMQHLELQRGLGLHDTPIRLWILEKASQAAIAIAYAQLEMTAYALKTSSYLTAKNKRLYDCTRVVREIHLLFLIKKGSNVNSRSVKKYYIAPNLPYYTIVGQLKET